MMRELRLFRTRWPRENPRTLRKRGKTSLASLPLLFCLYSEPFISQNWRLKFIKIICKPWRPYENCCHHIGTRVPFPTKYPRSTLKSNISWNIKHCTILHTSSPTRCLWSILYLNAAIQTKTPAMSTHTYIHICVCTFIPCLLSFFPLTLRMVLK